MRIVVMGPAGKMGKLVIQEALKRRRDFMIVGGVVPEGRPYVRQDLGMATGTGFVGASCYDELEWIIPVAEGVIDFTKPEVTMQTVKKCVEYMRPLVIGTTGFDEMDIKRIEHAATKIPILLAENTSKATNLMYKMIEDAAKIIGNESDVEIIDIHDKDKLDAPSGTARRIGHIIADSMGKDFDEVADYGREGKREEGHIGFHSVRAGDVASNHTVIFGMMGERLEITHRAYDFRTYAKGALDGLLFLKGKKPGLYTFKDVLAEQAEKAAALEAKKSEE